MGKLNGGEGERQNLGPKTWKGKKLLWSYREANLSRVLGVLQLSCDGVQATLNRNFPVCSFYRAREIHSVQERRVQPSFLYWQNPLIFLAFLELSLEHEFLPSGAKKHLC